VATAPGADSAEPDAHVTDAMPDQAKDEDEPVIDLWDTVGPQAAATVEVDEEFIDLESRAQTVLTDATDAFDYSSPAEAAAKADPDADPTTPEDDNIVETPVMPAAWTDLTEAPVEESPTARESMPGAMFGPMTPTEVPDAADPVPLTQQQVEDALQRVIEKIYGEKIEHLLIRTIEKTIQREIEKIKNALLEDSDGMVG
jgi:hypothetical protein